MAEAQKAGSPFDRHGFAFRRGFARHGKGLPPTRPAVLVTLCFLVGLAGARAAEPQPMPLHETPQPLPEVSFTDEAGTPLTLDAWRGKIVLLNIWATWCAPCRAEMPTLDRLQAELGGERFEVAALSVDRAGVDVVRTFFEEIGIEHLRLYIDETMKAHRDLKIFGLPGTILVGPDGSELGRLIGPAEWDTPEMITFFEAVIANTQEGN